MIAVVAAATAAEWSTPEPVPAGVPVGLPRGAPLHVTAAAPPTAADAFGDPVPLHPTVGGWRIDGAEEERTIRFAIDVAVRRLDDDAAEYAWNRWELRPDGGLPPDGDRDLAAWARVRAAALDDRAVVRLAAVAHAAPGRPLAFPTHAEGPSPIGPAVAVGSGPGTWHVAGLPDAPIEGHQRRWIPPGSHPAAIPGGEVRRWRTRGWIARPWPRQADGIAAAELAWWVKGPDAAPFAPWRDAPGPAGALARARIVEAGTAEDAARLLSTWLGRGDPDDATLLADAALARVDLPDDLVAAAVLAAPAVDPARLAAWLDRGRPRAVGHALLDAAAAPAGPTRGRLDARAAIDRTRLRRALTPTDGAVAAMRPGIGPVRAAVTAPTTVTLPDAGARWPVLRLEAADADALVDGTRWHVVGRVSVALPPGPHEVVPVRGPLWLVDPEVAPGLPTDTVATWWALPARFEVPGVGEPGLAWVAWSGGGVLHLDDGAMVPLPDVPDGVRRVHLAPGVTHIDAAGEGEIALYLSQPRGEPSPPVPDTRWKGPLRATDARAIGADALAEALEALEVLDYARAFDVTRTDADARAITLERARLAWRRISRFDDAIGYLPGPPGPDGEGTLLAQVWPDRPARVRLGADVGVVRVRATAGRLVARLGDREVDVDPEAWLPLAGVQELVVRGDGVVEVSLGLPRDDVTVPAPPPPGPRLAWEAALARVLPSAGPERLPSGPGTWRVSAGLVRTQHVVGDRPYVQAAVEGAFQHGDDAGWWLVDAWAHAPRAAVGLDAEKGWRDRAWRASVTAHAAAAREHARAAAEARGLFDVPITPDTALRFEAEARAVLASKGTGLPVDPRAWSAWSAAHPLGVGASAGLWARPWRDVRLEGGVWLQVNAGPGPVAVQPYGMAAWLVDPETSITAEARARAVLGGTLRPAVDLRVDRVLAATPSLRWSLRADVGVRPRGRIVGGIALVAAWSDARGSRDQRPDADAFRALRATP